MQDRLVHIGLCVLVACCGLAAAAEPSPPASSPSVRAPQAADDQVDVDTVDAETRQRAEDWLDDLCAEVVGRPMLASGVLSGGDAIDLEALAARVRELAREPGRALSSRLTRELRELLVQDFVLGDAVDGQRVLQLERRSDGRLEALIFVLQAGDDWSMLMLLEERGERLVAVDWKAPELGMWASELALELHGVAGLPQKQAFEQLGAVLGYGLIGDFDLAHEQLQHVSDVALPGTLESFRDIVRGIVQYGRSELELAEASVARALERPRVAPIAHYLAALLFDERAEHAAALEQAQAYLAAKPHDPDGNLIEGWSRLGLGQPTAAARAGQRALELRPGDVEALELVFLGTAEAWSAAQPAAPDADAPDAGAHDPGARDLALLLARSDDPTATAFVFADVAWQLDVPQSGLELLARAVEAAGCCGEFASWARARSAWWIDDWDAIIEQLAPRLDDVRDATLREWCVELLVEAYLVQGEPLAAYELPSDRALAFRFVAESLIDAEDDVALAELVARHEREPQAAGDPWLDFARGVVWEWGDDARKAELSYAAAQMGAGDDQELADRSLDARLWLRWLADDLAGAYDELEPQAEVLARLLSWCDDEDDAQGLATLLELHAADHRPHGEFPAAQVRLLLLRGDDARALDELLLRRATLSTVWGIDTWERHTLECLLRLGQPERALELARASTARDGDPYFELLVHAVLGDAQATQAALDAWFEALPGADPDWLWNDALIAEALRGEALAEVAARYPEPE